MFSVRAYSNCSGKVHWLPKEVLKHRLYEAEPVGEIFRGLHNLDVANPLLRV
jgi:hypothetical protein